jgi:hypothetical protein
MDLGATEGCREAIACLEMHCNLLKGSTSKEVLEVFYREVGIRLQQYVLILTLGSFTDEQDSTTSSKASDHIPLGWISDYCRFERVSRLRIFLETTADNGRFRQSEDAWACLHCQ